ALRQRLDRGDSLEGAFRYVDRALEKRGVTAFDRERSADRHGAVASTLGMSMDLLDGADRVRCAQLAIFPEDIAIPSAVLGELWGLDDLDVEDVLSRLHDASLTEFDLSTGTVRVHDVMRACLVHGPISALFRIAMPGAGWAIICWRRAELTSCERCSWTSTGSDGSLT